MLPLQSANSPLPLSKLARIIAVDLVPLYHQSLTPTFVSALRDYYIATYSDRFFSPQAPAWFRVYIWMEALYHIPLSIWALKGLWQGTLYLYELCDWLKIITTPFSSSSISKFLILLLTHLCNSSVSKLASVFPLFPLIIRLHSCLYCSYLSSPALLSNKMTASLSS